MAWLIKQTERLYLKAKESNQLVAAIVSLNLMHRIILEATKKTKNLNTEIVSFKMYHRSWR